MKMVRFKNLIYASCYFAGGLGTRYRIYKINPNMVKVK